MVKKKIVNGRQKRAHFVAEPEEDGRHVPKHTFQLGLLSQDSVTPFDKSDHKHTNK